MKPCNPIVDLLEMMLLVALGRSDDVHANEIVRMGQARSPDRVSDYTPLRESLPDAVLKVVSEADKLIVGHSLFCQQPKQVESCAECIQRTEDLQSERMETRIGRFLCAWDVYAHEQGVNVEYVSLDECPRRANPTYPDSEPGAFVYRSDVGKNNVVVLQLAQGKGHVACYAFFAHRLVAAFRAISERCSGVSAFARAFPPFSPPSFPSRTASGFLRRRRFGWPVSSPTTLAANSFGSVGILERLRMTTGYPRGYPHGNAPNCQLQTDPLPPIRRSPGGF